MVLENSPEAPRRCGQGLKWGMEEGQEPQQRCGRLPTEPTDQASGLLGHRMEGSLLPGTGKAWWPHALPRRDKRRNFSALRHLMGPRVGRRHPSRWPPRGSEAHELCQQQRRIAAQAERVQK